MSRSRYFSGMVRRGSPWATMVCVLALSACASNPNAVLPSASSSLELGHHRSRPTPTPNPTAAPTSKPTSGAAASTGILVPLYSYPSGSAWSPVISAKQANPNVPVVAIANPNSGPGSAIDQGYVAGVAQLKAAGVSVIGYVHTSYGAIALSTVEAQIAQWHQWYAPNGIFLDEMDNVTGKESYYATLTQYAKSLGMTLVVGNPGADTVPSYIGTVDTIVIYENAGYPSASFLSGGWHASYPKSNFAFISYGVSSLNASADQSDAPYVRYEYVTNQSLPNPYGVLPAYFSTEASTP